MRRFFAWFARAPRALPFQPTPEREVNDELSFHLEQRVREYIARGMSPDAARKTALERFGNLPGVQQECMALLTTDRRSTARRDWLGDLRQDMRFALRSFARAPLFTMLAVLTLALGIGANAATFGVVKSVLLDALPYPNADRLVRIYGRFAQLNENKGPLSAGSVDDLRKRQHSFVRIAAFAGLPLDAVYTGSGSPRAIKVALVEPELFATLGIPMSLGRPLRPDDIPGDTARAVVLSYDAWQRFFAGDPAALGGTVTIDGARSTVAGILPRDFIGPVGEVDVYYPLSLTPYLRDPVRARRRQFLGAIGRLKSGVTVDAARRELVALAAQLEREYPSENRNVSVNTVAIRNALVGDTRARLLVLMASAGLVLLIMCANLAGALLSRTLSRRKELAVRMALGAGQGRIVRQLLTESILLALAGGIAGILLAFAAIGLLRGLAATALPDYVHLSLDPGALVFAFVLALMTGLVFGAAPALSAGRWNSQATLREETRGTSESRRSRSLRGVLVAGQIALSVSLLAGAGLLARSLWAMTTAPLGFRPDNVLVVPVQLAGPRYDTPDARIRLFEQLAERLRGLPGVTLVGSASSVPTRILDRNGFTIEGVRWPNDEIPFALYATISDDYFKTLGIPLLEGRSFDARDAVPHGSAAPLTVVISESMARRWWPKGNALGARIRMGPDPNAPLHEVIGIVGDVRNDPAATTPEPMMYESLRQYPWNNQTFVLRASVDPQSLTRAVGRALASLDPTLPLSGVSTFDDLLASGLAGRRLPVVLMAGFGLLALVLVSVGVYAMFATMAAAREREFGVRVALGSSRGAIAALVLRQGAAWMLLGLALGGLGVVFVGRAIRAQLFGIQTFDPLALGAAVVVLLVCAAAALFVPVRRATRADPILVLR